MVGVRSQLVDHESQQCQAVWKPSMTSLSLWHFRDGLAVERSRTSRVPAEQQVDEEPMYTMSEQE